nr:hypothetical protein Iba_chr04cCG17030 [Ipomoea batatas]
MSDVELKMNETFWEYENIACLKYFGEEFVLHSWCWIRKDKSNIEGAFQDCLLRPWKRKSLASTSIGFLQIFPLTNTAIRSRYIPAALESLTATQKSCKGLGSDACANEDANANTAMAMMSNLKPIFSRSENKRIRDRS